MSNYLVTTQTNAWRPAGTRITAHLSPFQQKRDVFCQITVIQWINPEYIGSEKLVNLNVTLQVSFNSLPLFFIFQFTLIPPSYMFTSGDCSCVPFKAQTGYGNCKKVYKKGPICYVNKPTTCSDVVDDDSQGPAGYSWEACHNYKGNSLTQMFRHSC